MLAPDGPSYTLFVNAPGSNAMAARLDELLRKNPHYAYCEDLGQLTPVQMATVGDDADALFARRLMSSARKLGDIKPAALSQLGGWREYFSASQVSDAASS